MLNAKGVTERTKGRKKTYEEPQREYLFDQLNKHLEKALVDSCKLRRINLPKDTRHKEIGYQRSESRKCCYFQLCRTNTKVDGSNLRLSIIFYPCMRCRTLKKALLLEVTCDFGKNILKLIIYSFNLKLFDFHVADFDETESEMLNEYSSMLRNDIEIADELNQITESLDFQKFVATFHLKIIHKVLVDHYNFQKGGHVKPSFSNKRPVELFDSRKGDIF